MAIKTFNHIKPVLRGKYAGQTGALVAHEESFQIATKRKDERSIAVHATDLRGSLDRNIAGYNVSMNLQEPLSSGHDAASMDIEMAAKGRLQMDIAQNYQSAATGVTAVAQSQELQAGGLNIIQGTMPAGIYLDPNSIAVQ